MNFYALNVAPLAGWETHLGVGSAGLSASASGTGRRDIRLSGTAALSAVAAGGGKVAKTGAGSAAQAISASGSAYARLFQAGSATATLAANGSGRVAPRVPGSASITAQAAGVGVVSPFIQTAAIIHIGAVDMSANSLAVAGQGQADTQLQGSYGIPASPQHLVFTKIKSDRVMLVATDSRKFSVLADVEMRLRKREPLRVARNRRS